MLLRCVPVSETPQLNEVRIIPIRGPFGRFKLAVIVGTVFGDTEIVIEVRRDRKPLECWHYVNGVAEKGVRYNEEDWE